MSKAIQIAKTAKDQKGKLMLNPTQSPLTSKQLLHILQRTPTEHIYHRKGKGGRDWDYVTGIYVKKVLNYVFGWMWDFEVKEHSREGDQVWVLGRLTINTKKGQIIKTQFGRSDSKFWKGTKNFLDYGNDLKAATTDALKKCASELGIASDVYGQEEFKEIQRVDKGFQGPQEPQRPQNKTVIDSTGANSSPYKVSELKKMLKGETDKEKLVDLKRRTGIIFNDGFNITGKHAGIVIASLLNKEVKK